MDKKIGFKSQYIKKGESEQIDANKCVSEPPIVSTANMDYQYQAFLYTMQQRDKRGRDINGD